MIENSHATKNPFSATDAAITASFPTMIQGASHCVTIASASGRIEIRKFIAVVASLHDAHRDAVGAFRVAKRLQIGNEQNDLAFWRLHFVMGEKFGGGAAAEFFEFFGQFARDA